MARQVDALKADDMVDVRRAAALVGRHPETVRRWIWSGRLVAHRRGNRLVVARSEVEAVAGHDTRLTSLRAWADRARAEQASSRAARSRRSAADLVLEDRRLRSRPSASHAGR